jgi:hypothetical protein
MNPAPLEVALQHWGEGMPDWVRTLAVECGRTSQVDVGHQLGRSGAVVSQVLRNKYPADTARIEERVRGVFLDGKVDCPAFGALPLQDCQDWREKARTFEIGNPTRVRMYRACHACPRFQKEVTE